MIEYNKKNKLKVITIFSGYDAQLLSLERLKLNYPEFDYDCVGWCEVDKYACIAHDALFPQYKGLNLGDVCKIDWTKAPDCDLMTYSFPCTSISSAGQQKGLAEGSGTASSLLWECRRAIQEKHPTYLLMENVPALLTDKFKPFFMKWLDFLTKEGYESFTKILGSQDFGVPQHRDRVFCVSILDPNAHYYFPEPFKLTKRLKDVLEDNADESFYLNDERVQGLIKSTLKQRNKGNGFESNPKTPEQIATTVQASGNNRKTDNYVICGAIRGRKDSPADEKHHLELEVNSPDVSNTITSVRKDNVIVIGNNENVANTVTSHYAKEKTSNLVRQAYGGQLLNGKER